MLFELKNTPELHSGQGMALLFCAVVKCRLGQQPYCGRVGLVDLVLKIIQLVGFFWLCYLFAWIKLRYVRST